MGLFVNTNVASLNAQRQLLNRSSHLNKSFERLSSGLRVNRAADDAAGLAISERFNSQVRGLNQAVRNANDAVSLVQVAESALQESTNILQRIRELAVQSASDVNTEDDRRALHAEVQQLQDELERIGNTTTFNQQNILDGSYTDKFFHIGMNFRETLRVRVRDARSSTIGRYAVQTSTEVNGNAIGAGDVLINGVTVRATQVEDDLLSTTAQASSAIAKAAAINDSTQFHGVTAYTNAAQRLGTDPVAGGTLDQANNVVINGRTITGFTVLADDPNEELVKAINAEFEFTGVLAARNAQGQIVLRAEDGRNVEIVANGNGANITGLQAGITRGTVTLHSENQFALSGAAEVAIGFVDNALVGVSSVQAASTIDVTTREGANLALLIVDRAVQQIADDRAQLGAVQNRLESTITNLATVAENAAAARSRILDADFAAETASLARNQILQQAATNILAQANQTPQAALQLLQ